MAEAASLNLPAYACRGDTTLRIVCLRIGLPSDAIPLVQEDGEPFQRVIVLPEGPPAPLAACPVNVAGAFAQPTLISAQVVWKLSLAAS